jgi:hypothetical protein
MKSVWKFHLHPAYPTYMPIGAKPLSVHAQNDDLYLWALVDTDSPVEGRKFVIVGTGHEVNEHAGDFIGTAHLSGGSLVLHVFEAK